MASDLRLATDWPDHWKTRGLVRKAGPDAPRCLLRLWCYASDCRPDGDLTGLRDDEIADAAKWPETEPTERLVDALVELRWLDGESGAYRLHDWSEHQPWIAEREKRREAAKALADRRWEGKRADAARIENRCDTHQETMRDACRPVCQPDAARIENRCSQSQPNPTQKIKNKPLPRTIAREDQPQPAAPSALPTGVPSPAVQVPAPGKAQATSAIVRRVFEHWQQVMGHPGANLDPKRRGVIERALKLGYDEAACCKAIDGCYSTPYNRGDNDGGTVYDALDLVLRDGTHIDRFIAHADRPPKPRNGFRMPAILSQPQEATPTRPPTDHSADLCCDCGKPLGGKPGDTFPLHKATFEPMHTACHQDVYGEGA